jgi:regulator of cell morphogenesis and NO signaling
MLDDTTTIRSIVARDFRAAAVFDRHGIDFCCGANQSVADACRQRGVDAPVLEVELEAAMAPALPRYPRFDTWKLDFLVSYILTNHHAYVRQAMPAIRTRLDKAAELHGERHPEVVEIADQFGGLAADLTRHLSTEEQMLFPCIQGLVAAGRGGAESAPPYSAVSSPVGMMGIEHQAAGEVMTAIRQLSGGYRLPDDACATFKVAYRELQAFEADLRQHFHLENNILFPKALVLARTLTAPVEDPAGPRRSA